MDFHWGYLTSGMQPGSQLTVDLQLLYVSSLLINGQNIKKVLYNPTQAVSTQLVPLVLQMNVMAPLYMLSSILRITRSQSKSPVLQIAAYKTQRATDLTESTSLFSFWDVVTSLAPSHYVYRCLVGWPIFAVLRRKRRSCFWLQWPQCAQAGQPSLAPHYDRCVLPCNT